MKLVHTLSTMFNGLSNHSLFGESLVAAGAILTSFFCPIAGLLTVCFATSMVDMYYGMKVARKLGLKLTSKRSWSGTLTKLRDEFVLILLAHLIEYVILNEPGIDYLSGGVTVVISLTELWSILENLNTINPEGPWRSLGKFLRKKGIDHIGIDINDDEHDNHDKHRPELHQEA